MAALHTVMRVTDTESEQTNVPMYPRNYDGDVYIKQRNGIDVTHTTLEKVLDDLGDLAFQDREEDAAVGTKGIVALTNSVDTDDATIALTAKGAKTLNDSKVAIAGTEDITGLKRFNAGLGIGNSSAYAAVVYDSETDTVSFS